MLGPVEVIVIEFEGNEFHGDVIPELSQLVKDGAIRIIDLLFINKDSEGNIVELELEDMSDDILSAFNPVYKEPLQLLGPQDAKETAQYLDNNCSAGILVFEHLWAKSFQEAVLASGGKLVANFRVSNEEVQNALQEA